MPDDLRVILMAHELIIRRLLARLSLLAEAQSGTAPRAWLASLLEALERDCDELVGPDALVASVRENLGGIVGGSIPQKP